MFEEIGQRHTYLSALQTALEYELPSYESIIHRFYFSGLKHILQQLNDPVLRESVDIDQRLVMFFKLKSFSNEMFIGPEMEYNETLVRTVVFCYLNYFFC